MPVAWRNLTPEQRDRYRAKKRAYMERYRAEQPEKVRASKKRWASDNRPYLRMKWAERYYRGRDDKAAEIAAMSEGVTREKRRRRIASKRNRSAMIFARRLHIQNHVDRPALECRILANVASSVPRRLNQDLRDEISQMLVEAIYTGRFPIKVGERHATKLMQEHHRMFTKFVISLDDVSGLESISTGQSMGFY